MTTASHAQRLHEEIRTDLAAHGLGAFERSAGDNDAVAEALEELRRFNEARYTAAHIRDVPFTHMFWEEWLDNAEQQQQQQQQQQRHRGAQTLKQSDGSKCDGKRKVDKRVRRGYEADMEEGPPLTVEDNWKRVHGSLPAPRGDVAARSHATTRAAKFNNSKRFPVDKSKWGQNACMYTGDELDRHVKTHHGSVVFSAAERVTMPLGEIHTNSSSADNSHTSGEIIGGKSQSGVGFTRASRFAEKMGEEYAPSAQSYHVPSLFGTAQTDRLRQVRVPPPAPKLGSVGAFGFGCDVRQHALYGGCLDGKCLQRASWERIEGRDAYAGQGDDGSSCDTRKSTSTLHVACARADVAIIDKLCRRGADIHAIDAQDRTVLHVAVQSGNLTAVLRLLENSQHAFVKRNGYKEIRQNPNVNAQDSVGNTPLHLAAMNGDANIASALCDAGADANVMAHDGTTPSNVSATQPVFQVIQARAQQQALEAELQALETRKQQLQLSAIRGKRPTQSTEL